MRKRVSSDEETHNYGALTKLVFYSGIKSIIEQNFGNHCQMKA